MPEFSETRNDLVTFPATVALKIARPEDVAVPEGVTVQPDMPVAGVIDTGADICAIYAGHAAELGLQQIDKRPLSNTTGTSERPIYLVDLIFDDGKRRTMEAAGVSFGAQKLDLVLGRDFLACADFHFYGPSGRYELRFD